ncbi:MAG: beta-ketoacyl-[Bacteroidales bacterium]|nr:beta-ketoacyl-[acyl-carrier-protein] synthase family protein [Bacteroidales bacterium]
MDEIVVTGMGVISALGRGVEQTVSMLLQEKSGVDKMRILKSKYTSLPVGEVHETTEELLDSLHYRRDKVITRTTLLGQAALLEATQMAKLQKGLLEGKRVAFISATTVGGMEKSEQLYHDFLYGTEHSEYIALHDCGACTNMIAEITEQDIHYSMVTTISTACSSAANAFLLAANLLRTGRADIVVAGGTECLSKFHLDGFNSLMILDDEVCKPFDKNRKGINLGEAAAYLVLESPQTAKERGVEPLCRYTGGGNRCDAFHQTASSPNGEGAYQSMIQALEEAGLQPSDIDYINAHGTGTANNDETEGLAVMRVFGDRVPPISSTKAFTGHSTSAAGALEAVISILALTRNFIPVSLNFKEKIDTLNFTPVTKTIRNAKLRHVMTNSFGFGGNDTSCIFSKL